MREIGDKARRWKGDKAGYVAKHMWLTKHYEKIECDHCGKPKEEVSRLEWANISGEYKRERGDYLCLCPSCHRKMDMKTEFCKNGHPRENNSYLNCRGHTVCKICASKQLKEYKERVKCKEK